jgi:N-acetyl-anhydromuramyl-L-alanine amidase AmpD
VSKLSELLQRATVREKGPWGELEQPRLGVMLHYTAGTDLSGLQWLLFDPKCKVSYNWLYLDDGTTVTVAPQDTRAYHAGVCRPSKSILEATRGHGYTDANSAFYGLAVAAESGDRSTAKQLDMVEQTIVGLFRKHQWTPEQARWRITDHEAEAWPRGRKVDTGLVLPLDAMRQRVMASLLRRAAA